MTLRNIESLSQYFGISERDLLSDLAPTTLTLIRQRIFSGPEYLPERYAHNASSFVRSSAHIVEFLSLKYGRQFMDRVLVDLNIHPMMFENLDNRINFMFFIDLLNGLKKQGLGDDEIDSLACYIFLRIQDTPLGQKFRTATDYSTCYEVLANHATLFDTNFRYEFDIDRRHVRLFAYPTEAEIFLADQEPELYQRLFTYKKKLVGWFPVLTGLSPLQVETPKCVSRGDEFTLYDLKLPLGGTERRSSLLRLLSSP